MTNSFRKAVDNLIENVDVIEVLEALGAKNIRDQASGWVIHSCLIDIVDPHHNNGDRNPSAAIDKKSKRYSCFSYGMLTLFDFLSMFYPDVKDVYMFLTEIGSTEAASLTDKLKSNMTKEKEIAPVVYSENILDQYSQSFDYMLSRGISLKALTDHKVCFDDDAAAVVFPLFENERLLGVQKRNLIPGKPKYSNLKGIDKDTYLFYTQKANDTDTFIVVESIPSALKLYSAGFNAIATLGAQVTSNQLSLMLKHKHLIFWPDDDQAGIKSTKKILDRIGGKTKISVIVSDIRGYDAADMSYDEIERNVSNAMNVMQAKHFIDAAYDFLKGA